jgi:mannan endo-1,4-beta-mannosidase
LQPSDPLRRLRRFALAALAVAALGCSGPTLDVLSRPGSGFLERRGDQLYLDGRPYRFLSFNASSLNGCGIGDEVPGDAELDAFFASLRPRSLVRTYGVEASGIPAIERAVAAAKARGHLLILILGDDGGECGDGGTKKTNEWYASGFRQSYLPWVQTVVARFADEPAVGMWEPMKAANEVDTLTLRTFYDVVGGEIRRLDPNHLVVSGTHGPWAYGGEDGYAQIHASAGIDVGSSHDFDNRPDTPPNLESALRAIAVVSKPLVIVELGMLASSTGDPSQQLGALTCTSWQDRREDFRRQFESSFATPLAGITVWNWLPVTGTGCSLAIGSSDPVAALVRDFPLP